VPLLSKKLLLLVALGGFVALNILGFQHFAKQHREIKAEHLRAVTQLKNAETTTHTSRARIEPVMDWLAANQPGPANEPVVQSSLQQLAENEAKAAGLIIKSQKILPIKPGTHYHRAGLEISINGAEDAFFKWCDRLNDPAQLRAISFFRLAPAKEDDTRIECKAIVEQWFVRAPPGS